LLFVPDKPKNVTLNVNISSNIVCRGIVVKFTCTADAYPAVGTYRLYENGGIIANMDGSGLTTRALNMGGLFKYRCEARNSAGGDSSSTVTLTVEGKLT